MAKTIFEMGKEAAQLVQGSTGEGGWGCKDRNLALTTVCVIYNLILELGWLLMHLPKGLPASPAAAAAAALAPIQNFRPEAKWAKAPSSAILLATASAHASSKLPLTHSLNVPTLMTKIMAQ